MKKDRRSLYIAILSFVAAAIWVGVSAYARLHQSTIPADVERAARPLNPIIDKSIFMTLTKRQ
ncbi:hypothetical protein HY440_01015 [Candidatus Microgenomates bacterium]|nr:hypothetical protein [Candidatus Microgenomates bacterium]